MGIKSILTREQLKDVTFERLGLQFRRVIITEEQMDIAIDNALQKFFEDGDWGTEERYAEQQLIKGVNNYTLPYEVASVVEIIETNNVLDFFSLERTIIDSTILQRPNQLRLLDIELSRQFLQTSRRMLFKDITFDFNPITKVLHLHVTPTENKKVVLKLYRYINEEDDTINFGNIYGHTWIKEYTLALSMIQLADNLAMYGETPLPNNMKVNFQYFLERGKEIRTQLETDLIQKYSAPASFVIG